jgi:glycosyltransferase involved in cell wall biosynthesis
MNFDSQSNPLRKIDLRVAYLCRAPGTFRSIEELFSTIIHALPSDVKSMVQLAPKGGANLWALIRNCFWAASLDGCELFHITGDIHYVILFILKSPSILTIHDLRFFEESRGIKRLVFWWFWLYLPSLRARKITVISEFTKARLLYFCPINQQKVYVIPNCVAPDFVPMPRRWNPLKSRVLFIGTTPNKNLERVAKACQGLSVSLAVLGRLSPIQAKVLDTCGLSYDEFCDLARSDVVRLYHDSDLLIFVSTYEGFGLPILEAQAIGRPVITSNISPMVDVAGKGALFVDPFDVDSIRIGIIRVLCDAALREHLVSEGFRNIKGYTAESTAARYTSLYCDAVNQ